jgi:hypothetical protein
MIPTFAAIFRLAIGSFYHTTSRHEPAVAAAADRVSDLLERDLRDQIYRNGSIYLEGPILDRGEVWTLDIERGLDIGPVAASENELLFTVIATTFEGGGRAYHTFPVSVDFSPDAVVFAPTPTRPFTQTYITFGATDVSGHPLSIHDLYFTASQRFVFDRLAPMEVSPELERESKAYFRAVNGHPVGITGGFIRMLYLSVVTIATLGPGDILPITTGTRLLVSTEAVLGIVVMGLFLNSLVRKRR